jgi:MFS family permease
MTDAASNAAPASDKARRNRIPLDWINFLLADVQDGLGPFLAIYLLGSEHWKPGLIGMVMTIAGLSTVVARTPLGSLIDRIDFKRELIMAAAGCIGVCVAVMALAPHFWPVAVAQAAGAGLDALGGGRAGAAEHRRLAAAASRRHRRSRRARLR